MESNVIQTLNENFNISIISKTAAKMAVLWLFIRVNNTMFVPNGFFPIHLETLARL